MKSLFVAGAMITLVSLSLAEPAAAQRRVRNDALMGGVAGMALGGIVGGGVGGVVAGGLLGGATGALIGEESERRQNGFHYWRGECYAQRPGGYQRMERRYCD